jgi:putative transcriptional regulator
MDNAMFRELLESVEQMDAMVRDKQKPSRRFEYPEPEVKAIREKTGLSQSRFALLIGVSKRTLENWEQGRRHPTGPAKALLKIVDADSESAIRALHGESLPRSRAGMSAGA